MELYFKYTFIYLLILYCTQVISKKMGFYDIPDKRKIHKKKILNTSGVAIYLFLVLIIYKFEFSSKLEEVTSIAFFIILVGFVDDRLKINPSTKLIFILLSASYLVLSGYKLDDIGTYETIGKLQLGKFSFVFTILAVGLLTNSFNYIDGVDGLLQSIILLNIFYIIFLVNNPEVINYLSLISISLMINIFFNLLPSRNVYKIFLGDCGSLFLGFFTSFLIIILYKFYGIHPSYLIWIAFYPVADFLFVTFYRIYKKKFFYLPDRNHLHHIILNKFKGSHLKTTLAISLINTLILTIGYLTTKVLGNIYSLMLFILLNIVFFIIRLLLLYRNRGVEQSGSSSGS